MHIYDILKMYICIKLIIRRASTFFIFFLEFIGGADGTRTVTVKFNVLSSQRPLTKNVAIALKLAALFAFIPADIEVFIGISALRKLLLLAILLSSFLSGCVEV